MPVTTRIITELSGSSRKPQSAWKVASCPLAMWNGRPAIQVNWITSCTLLRQLRKLPDRAGGKDEGEQHHAGADEIDEILQG